MIVHLAEVWVVLVLAFAIGCGGGALLFGVLARERFANAQLMMADAVGRIEDFGRQRLGMAQVWRAPRRLAPAVPLPVLDEEEPDPVWEVIDRAVEAVRADTAAAAPGSGSAPPYVVPALAKGRIAEPAQAGDADDEFDGLLWEVPELPDEIVGGDVGDVPSARPAHNDEPVIHNASEEVREAIDFNALLDGIGEDDVGNAGAHDDGYAPDDDQDGDVLEPNGPRRVDFPVRPPVDRPPVPQSPQFAIPPPPIPARQALAARNAWRQSRVPLLTAPAGNGQNEEIPGIRKPATLPEPRNGVPDNLTRIRGIGQRNEVRLNNLGIFHFSQIAAWTPAEIAWISQRLAFPERIQHDDWVGQAIVLASGGETGFTKASQRRRARRRNGREAIDEQAESIDDP